jgi:hypothetical protein
MIKSNYIILVLLVVVAYGCKDDSSSTSNEVTGTLRGGVLLYNEHGDREIDNSGVLIQCEGLPFSTISDSSGKWELKNLPTRTYSLSFSKEGYSTWKRTSYGFIAGGIVYEGLTDLHKPPVFTFTFDALVMPTPATWDDALRAYKDNPGKAFGHTSKNTPGGSPTYIQFLVSRKPGINISDRTTYIMMWGQQNPNYWPKDSAVDIAYSIRYSDLSQFSHGDTLYFRGYPSLYLNSYYDIVTDKDILLGYGQGSNVLSGIMQ